MADGKKSFVLYCDLIHTVELLDDILAGKLIKHLLRYVNDQNPETDDILLKVAFEPIKRQLKRDLMEWEEEKDGRSISGIIGNIARWHPDIYKQIVDKQLTVKDALDIIKLQKSHSDKSDSIQSEPIRTVANIAVNDTVTVNDTVKRENTAIAPDIKNSNLFRKPKIPTKQQVLEAILNAGGDKRMAKSFYEKYESTGWFLNGSPVVDYITLAQRFVGNWKANDKKEEQQPTAPTLKPLNHGI